MMNLRFFLIPSFMVFTLLSTSSCGGGGGGSTDSAIPQTPNLETQTQDSLKTEDLTGSSTPRLVPLEVFTPSNTASAAIVDFNGTLTLSSGSIITQVADIPFYATGLRRFPSLSITLITHNSKLIPLERDLISTWDQRDSFWDVVVGIGQIWSEAEDLGWQRASLPINLVSRLVGQTRNCVATFLYDQTEVSNTYIQCSQETTPIDLFTQSSMRALIDTQYQAQAFPNKPEAIATYEQEIAKDLPVHNWSDIDSDGGLRQTFNSGVSPTHKQSLAALIIDGEVYLQTPEAREGNYPFARDMRHGVYSVTKSMMGALSMLYFAQRYGDNIFDALISDYVPALANHPGWQDVTFSHALNMVVGTTTADTGNLILPFIQAETADGGVEYIATLPDDTPAPGEQFYYSSMNTFTFSYALQKYVNQMEGLATDYWDLVDENVLQTIGISHFATQRTLETNGSSGIPTLGWGAFPTLDETAKIALLFSNLGVYNGQQLLHKQRTEEALHRTSRQGYEVGDGRRYQHSFWLQEVFTGLCTIQVPHMIGHGGNIVAILPSGIIVIRYMDHNFYNLNPLVQAAESIRSSCP